jgi:hypothetical protein
VVVISGGVEQKAHYLAMDLPHSDACFVVAFPAETTEVFLEGHGQAFAYFGIDRLLQVVRLLHGNGIPLFLGTYECTDFKLQRELELYLKAGIARGEALRLAPLGAAQFRKQDQSLGTIERGILADMVLVAGDPTTDISQMRKICMVVLGETVYFPLRLRRSGRRAFAAPPATSSLTSANSQ